MHAKVLELSNYIVGINPYIRHTFLKIPKIQKERYNTVDDIIILNDPYENFGLWQRVENLNVLNNAWSCWFVSIGIGKNNQIFVRYLPHDSCLVKEGDVKRLAIQMDNGSVLTVRQDGLG